MNIPATYGGSQELEEYFDHKKQARKSLEVSQMREQKKLAVLKKLEETRPDSKITPEESTEI